MIKLSSRPGAARAAIVLVLGSLFAGSLTAASFHADGHVLTGAPKGKTQAIFHYDGLGRLIQKRHRKVSGVQTAKPRVDCYYDGVRRIQEIDEVPDILSLPPVPGYSLEQDYVYGPGYVDEFVAQIDDDG